LGLACVALCFGELRKCLLRATVKSV